MKQIPTIFLLLMFVCLNGQNKSDTISSNEAVTVLGNDQIQTRIKHNTTAFNFIKGRVLDDVLYTQSSLLLEFRADSNEIPKCIVIDIGPNQNLELKYSVNKMYRYIDKAPIKYNLIADLQRIQVISDTVCESIVVCDTVVKECDNITFDFVGGVYRLSLDGVTLNKEQLQLYGINSGYFTTYNNARDAAEILSVKNTNSAIQILRDPIELRR